MRCVQDESSLLSFSFSPSLSFLSFLSFFFFFLFKERSIRLSADNGLRNVTWRFPGDVSSLRACFLSFWRAASTLFTLVRFHDREYRRWIAFVSILLRFFRRGMMTGRMDLLFSSARIRFRRVSILP